MSTSPNQEINEGWLVKLKKKLSYFPLASMVAFNMCVFGALVFCICLYIAVQYIANTLNLPIVGKIVWLIMILHLLMAVTFLVMGAMSTGKTRAKVLTKMHDRFGTRVTKLVTRGGHIAAIVTSYILHFIWLLLPAVLLLPVAIVTGAGIGCTYIPECVTLSNLGIPTTVTHQITSEELIYQVQVFNVSDLKGYIDNTEKTVVDTLELAQKSGMVEKFSTFIEDLIPEETEIDKVRYSVISYVENVNINKYLMWIEDKVNLTMDNLANQSSNIGELVISTGLMDIHIYGNDGLFNDSQSIDKYLIQFNGSAFSKEDLSKISENVRADLKVAFNKSGALNNITLNEAVDEYMKAIKERLQKYKLSGNTADSSSLLQRQPSFTNDTSNFDGHNGTTKDTNNTETRIKVEEMVLRLTKLVKEYTTIGMRKTSQAAEWLKRKVVGVVNKAGDFALKFDSYIRPYTNDGIAWTRLMTEKAAAFSRYSLKYVRLAHTQFLHGYEVVKMYILKLEITQEGEDTFCSETRNVVCKELTKSSVCFILVFVAAIILNLSMVHWLMVLASNYVHIKQDSKKSREVKKQLRGQMYKLHINNDDNPPRFKQCDSGSLSLLTDV